jgi:hypothetical protein
MCFSVYLRALIVGLVAILALSPFPYWETGQAQPSPDSHEIRVHAWPAYQLAPLSFEAEFISNSEVRLTWTNSPGAEGIEIRAGLNQYPDDVTGGRLVFSGSGTYFNDINVDLSGEDAVYYRAWQIYAGPAYSVDYAQDSVEGENIMALIGQTALLIALVFFALWRGRQYPWLSFLCGMGLIAASLAIMNEEGRDWVAYVMTYMAIGFCLIGIGLFESFGKHKEKDQG